MKYRPDYPDRFDSLDHARNWARAFIAWYNREHHHTGLGLMTPAVVHYGHVDEVRAQLGISPDELAHPHGHLYSGFQFGTSRTRLTDRPYEPYHYVPDRDLTEAVD